MKNIFALIAALTVINCTSKTDKVKLACKDFKVGKFELINKESNRRYVILRENDYQVEQTFDLVTNQKLNNERYYKISWKNDCEYNLTLDTLKSQYDEFDVYSVSKGGIDNYIKNSRQLFYSRS